MATTTAKTRQDVDNMTRADRLYDSLNYTYGKKGEMLEQQYDKAFSQADRQALGRGMQRSSYNNQVLANINKQKIDALNDNQSAFIADYENRLGDIEEKEWEQNFQEKQFAENQRQFDTGLAWQKEQATTANNQWEMEFGANRDDTEKQLAWAYVQTALANGNVPSDDLLTRAGLTRADAELMAKQASGGGSGGNPNKEATNPYGMTDEEWAAFQRMMGYGNNTNKITGLGGNENKKIEVPIESFGANFNQPNGKINNLKTKGK